MVRSFYYDIMNENGGLDGGLEIIANNHNILSGILILYVVSISFKH